jgi:CubicO group peptidase (beta-lactamase class C family)
MNLKHLLLCTGIAMTSYCQSQTPADLEQKIEQLANQAWDMKIFSGSIGVARDGKIIYTKHYGYADWDNKKPFNENTLFDIGSFNKAFTREMINQLTKEGKLNVDDPLSKYLQLFGNENDNKITINHLLEMKSGLGDYLQAPGFFAREREGNLTLPDRLEYIKKQPLLFEPGKGEQYSNSGYAVLGAVIEKITGTSYDQNLKERILQPLGLKNTFYTKKDIVSKQHRAVGTEMNFKGEKKSIDDVWSDASPDGGMYATMQDLYTFISAFYNGLLPSGTKYIKRPLAGGSNYWNSVVVPFDDGTIVLVMANVDRTADELGRRIYAMGTGKEARPLEVPREWKLHANLKEKGIGYVEENLKDIVKEFNLQYSPRFLNYFGYRFMNGGDVDAGLALLELNNKLFPAVANTYDSLGEAWLIKGDKEKAKHFYKQALEKDPELKNAQEMLKKIEEGAK